jgi:hypothetical protein
MHQFRKVRRQATSRLTAAFEHSSERSLLNRSTCIVDSSEILVTPKKASRRFPETLYRLWVEALTCAADHRRNSANASGKRSLLFSRGLVAQRQEPTKKPNQGRLCGRR